MHIAPDPLTTLIDALGIGTWEWTLAENTLHLSPPARAMLGLAEGEDASFAQWRAAIHPEDVTQWERRRADLIAAERKPVIEYRMRPAGGALRDRQPGWLWVEDRMAITARDADGRPTRLGGVWLNSDQRKRHEMGLMQSMDALENALQERRSAQSSFSDLATVSDAWLWSQDIDLRFIRHSRGEHSPQYQLSSSAMLGRSYAEWLEENPAIRDGADWHLVLDAQASEQPFSNFVFPLPGTAQSGTQWCRISGTPVFDEAGEFSGYKGVGADITELYLARARAEEASRAKTAFLANMSHEIRTPLHGVLGMAEVLEGTLTEPAQQQMIGVILNSGQTLLGILSDILDMSKIEAGKIELEAIAFDPADLARRVRDLHGLDAMQKGIALDLELAEGAEAAQMRRGDPLRFQQILHNLVSNAIKFTEHGSVTLGLRSRAEDGALIVSVRDTGIGMSRDQLAHVFDAFFQADSSITRRFGGTGLGMAITRQLVQLMRGNVRVGSEPGKGTDVQIELPLPTLDAPEL